MARSLIQRFVGGVRIVVRRTSRPMTAEFDQHVREAVLRAESIRVVLVVFVGDGAELVFDAQQRAKLLQAGLFARPHAVLAPEVRPETVLLATWVGAPIRTFGADEFAQACDFLEIADRVRASVGEAVARMKSDLRVTVCTDER